MAKKEARFVISLACGNCKRRNYATTKNKLHNPDRLELKKYCKWCRRHQEHKEAR